MLFWVMNIVYHTGGEPGDAWAYIVQHDISDIGWHLTGGFISM